ncbi:hypothetical protein GSF22_33675, partial [Micromonospora echinofusca]|nr:hypothetical protein [Micromonospora echinofusca]
MLTWGGAVTPAPRDRAGVIRRLLGLTAAALVLLLAAPVVPVTAGPAGGECPPGSNDCNVWDDEPGQPG